MRPILLPLVLIALVTGCARPPALTAHGRPVEHWVRALQDANPKVRKKAVTALGHVGPADPAALPALAQAVKDRDAGVRDEAVLALLNLGPAAREALPALEEAQKDRDARVRAHAVKALQRVRGG